MHTVLVICADASTFESIAQHFPPVGWMVERAATTTAALRVAAADPPALAILHPSASNDSSALDRLRNALEFAGTPIISLVADDRRREIDRPLPPAPTPAIVLPLPIASVSLHRAVVSLIGSDAAANMPGAPPSDRDDAAFDIGDLSGEFDGVDDLAPAIADALALSAAGLDARAELAGAAPLDAREFDDDLEIEVIELAVGEPAGEEAEPGAVPPRLSGTAADRARPDEALADTGEFPSEAEGAVTGEMAPGPHYQRLLTRAIIHWEGEVGRVTGHRDKARDAFVRLRERAQALDAERARALDQLKRAGKEIVRLRGVLARQTSGDEEEVASAAADADTAPGRPALAEASELGPPPLPAGAELSERGDAGAEAGAGEGPRAAPDAEGGGEDGGLAERLERALIELGEAREELDRAWRDCDELTVRLGETEDRLRQAEATAEAAEAARAEAEEQFAERDVEAEAATSALAQHEGEIAALREELESLGARVAQQADALTRTEADLRARTAELDGATQALATARVEMETARSERDDARVRADQAEQGGASSEERLRTKVEAIDRLERRVAEVEGALEGARADALRWEGKASRLTASLDVSRAEAESWREERERLLTDLTAAREQLRSAVSAGESRGRGGPSPLVVLPVGDEAHEDERERVPADLAAEGDLAEALRAADAALSRAERRSPTRRHAPVEVEIPVELETKVARDEALEAHRAQVGLLQMELEIARQQVKEAQEARDAHAAATIRADDRRLGAAVALAENRLAELPGVRTSGQAKQKQWQSLLTQIGLQMSQVMKACADTPALLATGVRPEPLFQALKTLATESASIFSDRRFILDREETVLRLMRDKVRDLQGLPTGQPLPSEATVQAALDSGVFSLSGVPERPSPGAHKGDPEGS